VGVNPGAEGSEIREREEPKSTDTSVCALGFAQKREIGIRSSEPTLPAEGGRRMGHPQVLSLSGVRRGPKTQVKNGTWGTQAQEKIAQDTGTHSVLEHPAKGREIHRTKNVR
jgi:hypothetical protein